MPVPRISQIGSILRKESNGLGHSTGQTRVESPGNNLYEQPVQTARKPVLTVLKYQETHNASHVKSSM